MVQNDDEKGVSSIDTLGRCRSWLGWQSPRTDDHQACTDRSLIVRIQYALLPHLIVI
jgi:hypothetical protein